MKDLSASITDSLPAAASRQREQVATCTITELSGPTALRVDLVLGTRGADAAYGSAIDPNTLLAKDGPIPVPLVTGDQYLGRYRCGSQQAVVDISDPVYFERATNFEQAMTALGSLIRERIADQLHCQLTPFAYVAEAAGRVSVVAGNGVLALPSTTPAAASRSAIGCVVAMTPAPDGSVYLVTTSTDPQSESNGSSPSDLAGDTAALVQVRPDGTMRRIMVHPGYPDKHVLVGVPFPDVLDLTWHAGRLWLTTDSALPDGTIKEPAELYVIDPSTGASRVDLDFQAVVRVGAKQYRSDRADAVPSWAHRLWSAITFAGDTVLALDVTHRMIWRLTLSSSDDLVTATAVPLDRHVPRLAAQAPVDHDGSTGFEHPAVGLPGAGFAAALSSGDVVRIGLDGRLTARVAKLSASAGATFSHPLRATDPVLLTDPSYSHAVVSLDQRTFIATDLVVDGLRSKVHPNARIGTHYSVDRLDGSSLILPAGNGQPIPATWRDTGALLAIERPYELIALTPRR